MQLLFKLNIDSHVHIYNNVSPLKQMSCGQEQYVKQKLNSICDHLASCDGIHTHKAKQVSVTE